MSIYEYSAIAMNGNEINLEQYKEQVVLIVNTASQCGFTPQYEDLQRIYNRYKDKGFVILGFPCNQFGGQEPDDNEKVQSFCTLRYGVSFPMFQKVNVRDDDAHPLFTYLTKTLPYNGMDENNPVSKLLLTRLKEQYPEYIIGDSIKWNFTKFLIDQKGNAIKRYEPTSDMVNIEKDVEHLLNRL
ncbi:glutathione peroxidase [Bacillus sp. JJ722]|uniref:glutathione peroxidase n=1 Tax=Bacillus sp. JJ722 TaxID=3122973 RepID=UPI002FFFE061